MDPNRLVAENRLLRKLIGEKNDKITGMKSEINFVNTELLETKKELEYAKLQREQERQEMTKQINELKESSRFFENQSNLAKKILNKKLKAFDKRKKQVSGLRLALTASKSREAELKKKSESAIQENAELRAKNILLKEQVVEMKAKEEQNVKESEDKRKLLMEKLNRWKEQKSKELSETNQSVETLRRMHETAKLASSQTVFELQTKLMMAEKELEDANKKLASSDIQLEQVKRNTKLELLDRIQSWANA